MYSDYTAAGFRLLSILHLYVILTSSLDELTQEIVPKINEREERTKGKRGKEDREKGKKSKRAITEEAGMTPVLRCLSPRSPFRPPPFPCCLSPLPLAFIPRSSFFLL